MLSQEHETSKLKYHVQSYDPPENGGQSDRNPRPLLLTAEAIGRLKEARSHKYISVLTEINRRVAAAQLSQAEADNLVAKLKELSVTELGYEVSLLFSEHLTYQDLQEQYETQEEVLTKNHLLAERDGEKGIIGADNQFYRLPSLETVIQFLTERSEILRPKIEQGFTQLLLVPFSKKIDELIDTYKAALLSHAAEGKLFATKEDPTDPNEDLVPLDLDRSNPVYVWDEYSGSDVGEEPKLVYLPSSFTAEHGGKTKQELIATSVETLCPGWSVLLVENLPNLPRAGLELDNPVSPKTIAERVQLSAGLKNANSQISSPSDYLALISKEPSYTHETGFTPEDWLIYALQYLEKNNQVVDNYQGNGRISYLLGAYFPSAGGVPEAFFYRDLHDLRRAVLSGRVPEYRNDSCGVRVAVRV
jgi:hypothetical protein